MYSYLKSESMLYTVGHYDPNGQWIPESDWDNPNDAAKRVHYLNGGGEELAVVATDKVLTVKEVAGMLKVCERTIKNRLRSGEIKGFRMGNRWRITEEELNKLKEGK